VPMCQSTRRHIAEDWNNFCFVKVIYRMSNKAMAATRNFLSRFSVVAFSNKLLVQGTWNFTWRQIITISLRRHL
jgi:hypothetical protein